MTSFKQFRYRLEALGCRVLVWGIPRLSRGRCVRLGNALGAVAYQLDRRGRAVALSNLQCAFGESLSPARRVQVIQASYRNFLRTMLDLFWGQRLTQDNFRDWIEPIGFDALREQLAEKKCGAVLMGVHQGNWEWGNIACGFLGIHNTAVAEDFKNPLLTGIFRDLRQISGQTVIAQENSILRLLRVAKRGGATSMLIDLSLPPNQAATVIEGFGMKMCVPLLHAVLAERVGALLVPVETQPQADGTCRVIAHPAIEWPAGASIQEISQRCWDALSPIVRARPESYLWPYKHFRYRPKGAARQYPDYSNESGKFDKLLKACSGSGSKAAGKSKRRGAEPPN